MYYIHIHTHKCFTDAESVHHKVIFILDFYHVALFESKPLKRERSEINHMKNDESDVSLLNGDRLWIKVETNPNGEEIMFCDFLYTIRYFL